MTPPIFYRFKRIILLKNTASVSAAIHFEQALHVHIKNYLNDVQTTL